MRLSQTQAHFQWQERVQFSSVAQSCLTLCDPTDCSTPGFPVHHQLPELTQTHILWASDAIQPSHPLSSPSPPAFNLSLEGRQNEDHNKRGTPAKLAFPAFLCQRRLSFIKSPSWRKTLRHYLLVLGAGSMECVRLRPEAQGTRVTVRQLCTLSFLMFFFFFFPFLKPGAHIEDNHSGIQRDRVPVGRCHHIPLLVLTKTNLYFQLQKKHVLMGETWKTMMKIWSKWKSPVILVETINHYH